MSSFFQRAVAASLLASCTVAFAAKPAEKSAEAARNPIQVPGAVWAFDGFLLNIPSDSGWYSTAKDGHYADLSKDFGNGLKGRAQEEKWDDHHVTEAFYKLDVPAERGLERKAVPMRAMPVSPTNM